jgi:two-component system, cell cycle sensor histidine kinase and response regulator CckA
MNNEAISSYPLIQHNGNIEAISRLAAGIAHDFNHLFTVISGYTNRVLTNGRVEGSDAESLRRVAQAAQQAAQLTEQLQGFGRKNQAQTREQDLNAIVGRAVDRLQSSFPSNVELLLESATSLPLVDCEPAMVEQVVENLVENALEAMSVDGGQLRVSTRVIEVGAVHLLNHKEARMGRFVSLSIADTGCGMDTETSHSIFKPFFTTKGEHNRSGLGLAKVAGIVKLYRGWVEVNSQLGFGSTFSVFLPAGAESTRSPGTGGGAREGLPAAA